MACFSLKMMFYSVLVLLVVGAIVDCEVSISLDSSELDGTWTVRNANGSIKTNGRVPGGIYTDLHSADILNQSQSLFYRMNDKDYRWVSRDNWTYSRSFDLPAEMLAKSIVNLVLHGVDTVADVVLNEQLLGSVDNMFIRYVFPIKDVVKASGNVLEVRITSAISAAAERAASLPAEVLPNCVPDAYQGECHVNKLRKMQASFSWDWGPAFPSAGIWKSVEVEAMDVAVIRDVTTVLSKVTNNDLVVWHVEATVYADLGTETFDGVVMVVLVSEDMERRVVPLESSAYTIITNANFSYVATKTFIIEENEIELWWPNGFGEQKLYSLEVTLVPVPAALEPCKKAVTIGFRTLSVVEDALGENQQGSTFRFEVNGVPMFMKGSNWIPGHVLPELGADPVMVRHTLSSAKEAHMNMLRVWGGGVYESDLFYQVADEMGILIWQDLMFASSMYPTTDAFLVSSALEAEQQVRRLQHHPCIAVWAGNNENEAALVSGYFGTGPEWTRYSAEYLKLYIDTIMPIVQKNDPTRTYLSSSPSNGAHEQEEGYLSEDSQSPYYGDAHYYNYEANGWDSSIYPYTRFASEFGFESFSSFESLKTVSEPSDWWIGSEFSQMRQHHPNGYSEMEGQIRQHLPLGEDDQSQSYYQKFIYFSQIVQAMSTKTESERYRRDRTTLVDSKGLTMGALYWQLNDVWQGPTWAGIEFGGRWKMLHYFAKKFFSPVLVSPEITKDGTLNIYLVSDLLDDIPEVEVGLNVMSFDSLHPKFSFSTPTVLSNATSRLVFTSDINQLLNSPDCSTTTCFLHFSMQQDGRLLSENVYFPASFADVTLPPTNITVTLLDSTATTAILDIFADAVAPFVWFETAIDGVFSDNGFTLVTNRTTIVFESRNGDLDLDSFQDTLTIRDLTSIDPRLAIDGVYYN